MALTYITNGKIVLPDSVVCGKSLAFDSDTGKICGLVDELPADASVIDADGKYVAPDSLISISTDISEKMSAMETKIASERFLKALSKTVLQDTCLRQ